MARGLLTPSIIAIDTNLFSVLLLDYSLRSRGMRSLDRELHLRDALRSTDSSLEQFDALWDFFGRAERRIVTQHVIAEAFTNRIRRQSNLSDSLDFLRQYRVEEHACRVSDLYQSDEFRPILKAIGPTDAGLIYTAGKERAVIISEDGPLRGFAGARLITVLGFKQLSSG